VPTPSEPARPLDGVRILAFTQLGAGPFGMMTLSDLGAEVVKVEQPGTGGDEARTVPPYADRDAHDGLYYQAFNRGTRSLTLDVASPDGHALLRRLAPRFDAVFNNLRGDLTARLGLDYTALGDANPRLVCCSLSGFGRTGPRAGEPAYDYLMQAYAGFMSLTGEPDAPPTKCGVSIVDFAGGMLGALALMIGLHRAAARGVGGDVDVALLDAALSMLNYMGIWSLNRDWRPARHPNGAHQSLLPSQSFRTRDGWLVIMVMKEKFWERLTERLGRPALRDDPRFRTFADRLANRAALSAVLDAAFRERTTAEWVERLRGHVPVAPVYDVAEALADEHVAAREMIATVQHPVFGPLRTIGCPIKFPDAPPRYVPGAPLGADTGAVLAEVGVSAAEVAALRARGVV
jgi:crotonobetainyl-CoA:carnitine CoA-transferase CaiB-like acyl-CoA transferase